jgi:hypothetical protein
VSVLAYKLRNLANNIDPDVRPEWQDRELLLEAAELLDEENLTAANRLLLTNKVRLRAALGDLDGRELGSVLALVLSSLDDRGDSALSTLLRALADRVEEAENEGGAA